MCWPWLVGNSCQHGDCCFICMNVCVRACVCAVCYGVVWCVCSSTHCEPHSITLQRGWCSTHSQALLECWTTCRRTTSCQLSVLMEPFNIYCLHHLPLSEDETHVLHFSYMSLFVYMNGNSIYPNSWSSFVCKIYFSWISLIEQICRQCYAQFVWHSSGCGSNCIIAWLKWVWISNSHRPHNHMCIDLLSWTF